MVDLPDTSDVDEPPRGINLKKAAIVSAAVAGAALLVSGVVYGPTVLRVLQESGTRIDTPAKVGALTLDDNDDAKSAAEYIRAAINAEVNYDDSHGAIYRQDTRTVIFVAGTARVWKPEDSLSAAFKVVADDNGDVRDTHDVDSGSLGGVVRCGLTATSDGDFTVCGWADNGTVAVALFSGWPPADAAKTLLELRSASEHR